MVVCAAEDLLDLLRDGNARQASDLILVAGSPPCAFIHGRLCRLEGPVLGAADVERLLQPILSAEAQSRLADCRDLDFSLDVPQGPRCRINIHYQRRSLAVAVRFVPSNIPALELLQLPALLKALALLPNGFVLVTGPAGQGKSTTLAAMINHINLTCAKHIITLEDPIEFLFTHGKSLIEQRDIGEDSPSFASALRHVLRQKPDVILVGELRDRETIATAMSAAETGHLVFGTLHTSSSSGAIERIVDTFEGRQQQQVRTQLAHSLQAVVSQFLFPDLTGAGLVPACEILVATPAVCRAIRDSETHLIPNMIETGSAHGMCTMDQAIIERARQGKVSRQEALNRLASKRLIDTLDGQVATASPPLARPVCPGPNKRGK